jgi:hypothetical protein
VVDDLDYYWRRMTEEEHEAAKADRPDVRCVHEKLAALYEVRIKQLSSNDDKVVSIRTDAPMRAMASGRR